MWYLYLDESGDLGFDFVNKKPSQFFTITILLIQGTSNNRRLISAVKKVIRRKLTRKRRRDDAKELKGSGKNPRVKEYFYNHLKSLNFELFAISLNKYETRVENLKEKNQLYNYMASLVLEKAKLENATATIELIVDKSKRKADIQKFNQHLFRELSDRIRPTVRFTIEHMNSAESKALQAVDMFCWGIFQKYEHQELKWIEMFKEKIVYEGKYQ